MHRIPVAFLAFVLPLAAVANEPVNPSINAQQHLRIATEALQHRAVRRVSEAGFLRLRDQPGAVVLDARSAERFAQMHVDGAINLDFSDIAQDSLATLLPDRSALILIYCNNNFRNEPRAFPTKSPAASLNLSTYAALYGYGYRNIYELGPMLDPAQTRLPLVGTLVTRAPEDAAPSQMAQLALPQDATQR